MKNRYVIIKSNGTAENIPEGWTYLDILEKTDCSGPVFPEILIKNGKVIVSGRLNDLVFRYNQKYWNLRREMLDQIRMAFPEPDFELDKSSK